MTCHHALKNGYYGELNDWEISGYLYDSQDKNTIHYILYTPKGQEKNVYGVDLGEDDYDERYDYDFGTITTRQSD